MTTNATFNTAHISAGAIRMGGSRWCAGHVSSSAYRMSKQPKRAAFTLLELLAVIAIVGVLAALVLAILGPIRSAAKKTQSISNIRQIYTGLMLYDAENKKLPPLYTGLSTTVWARPFWNHRILPYMGVNMDPLNLSDPFYAKGGLMPAVFLDPGAPSTNTLRGDYGVNYSLINGPIRATTFPSLSIRNLVNPGKTPLVATAHEYIAGQTDPVGAWYFNNIAAPTGQINIGEVSGRYNGQSIIVFADGRVAAMLRTDFYARYLPFQNK